MNGQGQSPGPQVPTSSSAGSGGGVSFRVSASPTHPTSSSPNPISRTSSAAVTSVSGGQGVPRFVRIPVQPGSKGRFKLLSPPTGQMGMGGGRIFVRSSAGGFQAPIKVVNMNGSSQQRISQTNMGLGGGVATGQHRISQSPTRISNASSQPVRVIVDSEGNPVMVRRKPLGSGPGGMPAASSHPNMQQRLGPSSTFPAPVKRKSIRKSFKLLIFFNF